MDSDPPHMEFVRQPIHQASQPLSALNTLLQQQSSSHSHDHPPDQTSHEKKRSSHDFLASSAASNDERLSQQLKKLPQSPPPSSSPGLPIQPTRHLKIHNDDSGIEAFEEKQERHPYLTTPDTLKTSTSRPFFHHNQNNSTSTIVPRKQDNTLYQLLPTGPAQGDSHQRKKSACETFLASFNGAQDQLANFTFETPLLPPQDHPASMYTPTSNTVDLLANYTPSASTEKRPSFQFLSGDSLNESSSSLQYETKGPLLLETSLPRQPGVSMIGAQIREQEAQSQQPFVFPPPIRRNDSLTGSDDLSTTSSSIVSPSSASGSFIPLDQRMSRQLEKTGVRLQRRANHAPSLQIRTSPRTSVSGVVTAPGPANSRSGSVKTNTWNASSVLVKRRGTSGEVSSPLSCSSSINPSPAMSFLMTLHDSTSTHGSPHPGTYQTGDEIGDYILGKQIGVGAFATVFEAVAQNPVNDSPSRVALKIISKTDPNMNAAQQPFVPSRAFSTPNVLGGTQSLLRFGHRRTRSQSAQKLLLESMGSAGGGGRTTPVPARSPSSKPFKDNQAKTWLPVVIANLDKETTLWSRLRHPNILEMTDLIDLDDAMIIVSELAPGGTLLSYLKSHGGPGLPLVLVQKWFAQLVSALHYLHTDAGIIHRDIKLENILLDDDLNIKLADFGLSEELLIPVGCVETLEPPKYEDEDTTDDEDDNVLLMASPKDIESVLGSDTILSTPEGNSVRLEMEYEPSNDIVVVKDADGQDMSYHLSLPRSRNMSLSNIQQCAGSLHYTAPEDLRRVAASQYALTATQHPSLARHPHLSATSSPLNGPSHLSHVPGSSASLSVPVEPQGPTLTPIQKPSSDMWALGCVLYALLTGSLPFNDGFLPRLQLCIMNGKFDQKRLEKYHVPHHVQDIVKGLLEVELEDRWDILKLLQNQWVQEGLASISPDTGGI